MFCFVVGHNEVFYNTIKRKKKKKHEIKLAKLLHRPPWWLFHLDTEL